MLFRLALFILLVCFAATGTARADDYMKPSWPNLMKTMVRFNALNLADDNILDEYTIITECDLYKAFYRDDFKWHEVRKAVLQSVKDNIATFPMNYHYDTQLQLDRYDFNAKLFRFAEKSKIHNVNSFVLYAVEGTGCGTAKVKYVPRSFHAVIPEPVYMDGLPLAEKDAQGLLEQMTKDNNKDRVVYVRFNLRIVYVDPLRKDMESTELKYQQSNAQNAGWVRLDARLGSIDFYEDPEMQVLIYEQQL